MPEEIANRAVQLAHSKRREPGPEIGAHNGVGAARLEGAGTRVRAGASGAPGRGSVCPRRKGTDGSRGALLIHGHLDVVPAEPAEWSVHPFSGAIEDGYVWGRGAVDMKDMVGMMIVIARHFRRSGIVPPRDLVFAFVADEENGGKYG